jgi:TonB family protein
MKAFSPLCLISGVLALSLFSHIGRGALSGSDSMQAPEPQLRSAPQSISDQPELSEKQAVHALETEISRKVGLQMKETDYPVEARRWSWSGITLVHVLVGSDGLMHNVSVCRTSGFRILDERAVQIVSRVSAPSWIPERLRGRDVAVQVPVGFLKPQPR